MFIIFCFNYQQTIKKNQNSSVVKYNSNFNNIKCLLKAFYFTTRFKFKTNFALWNQIKLFFASNQIKVAVKANSGINFVRQTINSVRNNIMQLSSRHIETSFTKSSSSVVVSSWRISSVNTWMCKNDSVMQSHGGGFSFSRYVIIYHANLSEKVKPRDQALVVTLSLPKKHQRKAML